jgi:ankyrin repeat protein
MSSTIEKPTVFPQDADEEKYSMDGLPPLLAAAAKGEKENLQKLLSTPDVDVNQQASDGTTALSQAALHGQARCVKLLLKNGAKFGLKDAFGNLPIHLATKGDHRKSVEMLVGGGARVNRRDGQGLCSLHWAIIKGYEKMVKLLLEKGARVDKLTHGPNPQHPLHLAARKGNVVIMRQLLSLKPAMMNAQDGEGRTPIFLAVECDFPEIVSALIAHGVAVSTPSKTGETPLSLAIKRGYEDICHTLCTNGADVSLRYSLPYTPHRAALTSSVDRGGSSHSSHPPLDAPPTMVPSTIEPSTNQDDNTSVGSNLSDASDTDMDLVTQVDRYGHISKEAPQNPRSAKLLRIEMRRAKKWSDMISHWPLYATKKSEKLRKRVFKGIPDRVRGVVWKLLVAGIGQGAAPNTMATLAAVIDKKAKEEYHVMLAMQSKWTTQIDLDVNRAARNHMMFRERYGKGQRALFSILKAYSSFDTDVGYCQGMSDMTALLLKYVTEEEAYWMLASLMTSGKWKMRELFLPGFPKLQQAFFVHEALLSQYSPTLAHHLTKENVLAPFYTTKWYLLAFLDIFPFEVTIRLWDLLLAEGYEIVYSVGVGVMRMYEGEFLGKSFDKIMAFMRGMETLNVNADKFISFIIKNRIPSKKIHALEEEYTKKFVH